MVESSKQKRQEKKIAAVERMEQVSDEIACRRDCFGARLIERWDVGQSMEQV
jgi:hypothetical protein